MLSRIVLPGMIVVAMASVACGGSGSGDTKTATGLVTKVDAPTLTQLDGFTLHTDDDKTLEFGIAPEAERGDLQNGFVPSHLREHALLATKVKISYREESGELLALRIEDVT